jgi:cytochrome c oxidase subunit 2
MLRLIVSFLLLALLVLGIWTFFDSSTFLLAPKPALYPWWWPSEVSTFGDDIDSLFRQVSAMILVFFVLTEGLLVWFVFKYAKKTPGKAVFTHGNHKLEMLWTGIPAALLVFIALTQMSTFADIKFVGSMKGVPTFADVFASQFDWRFRYPGKDGRLGTVDDIESPFEFVVPVGEKIVFNLRSRDVLHAFFVPKLRLKQDAVPGMTIPVWFQVEQEKFDREKKNAAGELEMDLICAELCGWGHYKMAGRLRVLTREAYDRWLEEKTEAKYSNGQEDAK